MRMQGQTAVRSVSGQPEGSGSHSMPEFEKRIRYAIAEASTGYRSIAIHANDVITAEDLLRYAERIIDKHSFENMRDLISEYMDYLRFYHDGMTMDERRAQNGEPVFGYTLCPKPKYIPH